MFDEVYILFHFNIILNTTECRLPKLTFISCHCSSVCEHDSVSKAVFEIEVILFSPVFRLFVFEPSPAYSLCLKYLIIFYSNRFRGFHNLDVKAALHSFLYL